MSRRKHKPTSNAWEDSLVKEDMSAHEVRRFSERLGEPDRIVTEPIPLYDITPDPSQPRKILPSNEQKHFQNEYSGVPTKRFFEAWRVTIFGHDVDGNDYTTSIVMDILNSGNIPEGISPDTSQETFVNLIQLAATIKPTGLQAPIGVLEIDTRKYQIVYGERRWFAFHVLHAYLPDDVRWRSIPAKVLTDEEAHTAIIQQAIENTNREDLNAIGKARQLAKLLMYHIERDTNYAFGPFTDYDHEQAFYAQVVDMSVPGGRTNEILNQMNFADRSYISKYRKLLTLPIDLWEQADHENWTINKIAKATKTAEKAPEPQNSQTKTQVDMFNDVSRLYDKYGERLDELIKMMKKYQREQNKK